MERENRFTIAPRPGGQFTQVSLKYRSIYGEAVSRWEKKAGEYLYHIEVPANCTASLILPGLPEKELSAGSYDF